MDVSAPGYATSYVVDPAGPAASSYEAREARAASSDAKGLPSPGDVLRMNAAAADAGAPAPPPAKPKPASAQGAAEAAAASALRGGGAAALFPGFKSSKAPAMADSTTAGDMTEKDRRSGWEDFQRRINSA